MTFIDLVEFFGDIVGRYVELIPKVEGKSNVGDAEDDTEVHDVNMRLQRCCVGEIAQNF